MQNSKFLERFWPTKKFQPGIFSPDHLRAGMGGSPVQKSVLFFPLQAGIFRADPEGSRWKAPVFPDPIFAGNFPGGSDRKAPFFRDPVFPGSTENFTVGSDWKDPVFSRLNRELAGRIPLQSSRFSGSNFSRFNRAVTTFFVVWGSSWSRVYS
mgnify:CR=1 FL=1